MGKTLQLWSENVVKVENIGEADGSVEEVRCKVSHWREKAAGNDDIHRLDGSLDLPHVQHPAGHAKRIQEKKSKSS